MDVIPATERWRESSVAGWTVGVTVVGLLDCPEDSHFQEPSGWAWTAANRSKHEQRVLNLIVVVCLSSWANQTWLLTIITRKSTKWVKNKSSVVSNEAREKTEALITETYVYRTCFVTWRGGAEPFLDGESFQTIRLWARANYEQEKMKLRGREEENAFFDFEPLSHWINDLFSFAPFSKMFYPQLRAW